MKILFSKLDAYNSLTVKTPKDDTLIIGVLGRLCYEYRNMNIDSSLFYCAEALRIASKIKYNEGMAIIYNQAGLVYRQRGEYIKALDFYEKALSMYQSFQKTNPAYYNSWIMIQEGRTLNNMAVVYMHYGEDTIALRLLFRALTIDETKGNKEGSLFKLGNIGDIYKRQGQYDKALKYYFNIARIADSIGNKGITSQCYNNIGLAYWKKGDKQRALEFYEKSIDLSKIVGNKQFLSDNYTNKAIILQEEKKYDEALGYYNKSLQLKKETGDRSGRSSVLGNMGMMYLHQNIIDKAEEWLLQAKLIADSVGDKEIQLEIYQNLCSLYTKKAQYKEALEFQQKATSTKDSLFNEGKKNELTVREMNYKSEREAAIAKAEYEKQIAVAETDKLRGIAEADKRRIQTEFIKQLELSQATQKLSESETSKRIAVADAENKRTLAEAEKKRVESETGKKMVASKSENDRQKLIRNVIALGAGVIILSSFLIFLSYKRKRDADQKQKDTALNLQVSETEMKALRSQMNPHFIFNALQSIQTFLMNHKPDDANTYLLKFSRLMRLVLENSQYTEVALKDDIQALELYMQLESIRLPHPFTYKIDVDKNVNIENDTIPPLILQPFVENAIWHGLQYKPTAGHIGISLSKNGDILYATVIDNGVGRNNAEKNSKPLLVRHESLGMKLTQDRLNTLNETKQVNAGFTITDLFDEQQQPAGTKVELSLPLAG